MCIIHWRHMSVVELHFSILNITVQHRQTMSLNYLLKRKSHLPHTWWHNERVLWALKCSFIYFVAWSCCFFLLTHLIYIWHHEINMRVKSLARQRWKRECDKACERERFLSSWFCVSGAAFVGHIHPSSPIFQIPGPNVSLPLFSSPPLHFFCRITFVTLSFFSSFLMSLCLTRLLLTSTFFW